MEDAGRKTKHEAMRIDLHRFFKRPELSWFQLLFYLVPPLLAVVAFVTTTIKTDISAFILAGESAEEILLAGEMQSGVLSRRYLLSVGAKRQGEGEVPQKLIRDLRHGLLGIEGVSDIWSPSQQRTAVGELLELYRNHAGSLYSLDPETDLADLFTPQGLQQRASLLKQALLSPQGGMVKAIAERDPLLLTLDAFKDQAGALQQAADPHARYQNLILETTMAGLDVPEQSRIQQAIRHEFAKLNQSWGERFQLDMTGVPVFAVATQSLIKGDIEKVSTLSSIALVALFLLLFRSFNALFQVFSLLLIVILSAILVTQAVFGYVHGMTVAIGSTLVGICIDYPIHAIVHAQTVDPPQRRVVVARIWPSMVLGGMTTLIGYIALGASGYPGFQQIAVYAGTGILLALLLTRFVLPRLVRGQPHRCLNMPLVDYWAHFCRCRRRRLMPILVVALGIAVWGMQSLRWLEDMQQLTPELNYLKDNDKRIRARMVSVEPGRFIMVTAAGSEAALRKTEQVYRVLEELKSRGSLSEYFGLQPWLLSIAQQRYNRQALDDYLTDGNLALWREALEQQGLSRKMLGHFDYPRPEPITLERVWATPVKRLLDSRVIESGQQTVVMVWVADHDYASVKAAFADMPGVQYFSYRELLNNMLSDYTEKAQMLLLTGLGVIVLLLIGRYRSLYKAVQTLLPAVLAAFFIFGIWGLSGALVSFLHLVGFLLAVAICVDYGIFYRENRGGDIGLTYQAMAASMLTSVLAFGCLIAADSASLRTLAGVVAFGVLLGFLLCPIIIGQKQDK